MSGPAIEPAALRAIVGDDGVVEGEPLALDGVAPALTLRPADGDALSRLIAELGARGAAVVVRGGGSRLGIGNPPSAADAWLSTERLAGIEEIDTDDGVCRARAGTPIAVLSAAAREAGWELPLDPPGARATLGGCLAAAASGPRALGFGSPRDVLLGLDVCLGSGERTRCGGRVVKNVTGYDLNKLYTGSFGTLGVIEAAWLRLVPQPQAIARFEARVDGPDAGAALAVELARRPSARVAALVVDGGGARVVAELAGDARGVERDGDWLGGCCDAVGTDEGAVGALRERQIDADGMRFRIGALPTRLAAALRALADAGAELLAYPGRCVVYAQFRGASDRQRAEACFEAVGNAAAGAGGDFVCEAAATDAKRGRDVFGGAPQLAALQRALKQRFDPRGVLNPGRFAGGI